MRGLQVRSFRVFLDRIDLSSTDTLCDVGGASGVLAAQRHPHLRAISFDLPAVERIAKRTLVAFGVDDRVAAVAGDFFVDDLPSADVLVMSNILHDWNDDQKLTLITKAYRSLMDGGRLVVIENIIDDTRHECVRTADVLNMLIETSGGSDYTGIQFDRWCRQAWLRSERDSAPRRSDQRCDRLQRDQAEGAGGRHGAGSA